MRCPKCHYISFDSGERCRNCGYDFSLSGGEAKQDGPKFDLPIQPQGAADGPMADFELSAAAAVAPAPERPVSASDLPLFTDRGRAAPTPMINQPPAPRPPLSVRKSNPVPRGARPRADEEPTLDLGPLDARSPARPRAQKTGADQEADPAAGGDDGAAGIFARLMAGLIDTSIMMAVHGAVIYFTLRLCGLTVDEIAALPPAPMVAFLLLLTGGYFVSFTAAGGQTIGKMAAGIRVVPAAAPDAGLSRVPFGSAVLRAAACLLSVLPAGAGLVPALFGADHRALHDRLADTRVVKA